MRDPLWPGRLADMFDTAHSISRPLIGITSSMNTAMFIARGSGMPTRPALVHGAEMAESRGRASGCVARSRLTTPRSNKCRRNLRYSSNATRFSPDYERAPVHSAESAGTVTQFHQARERQTFLRRLRTRLIEKGDASASRRFHRRLRRHLRAATPDFCSPASSSSGSSPYLVCCSALWRRANCIYEHRNTEDCNDVTEQAPKGTERVAGRFCHVRTNAIMRPTPVAGCPRSP